MNSLVKVFSNFKEFYSEINGATLTGAIDVVVVEQPDGSFLCSPFHVRFGKLGVLRSRQKIVDIEVNGEPVDIHMKLGESGEAFFVQECPEDELEKLPANMATSPLPTGEFNKYGDSDLFVISTAEEDIDMPKPRRNSIDFSKESEEVVEKKFDNQVSDFSHRRHTDTMERRNFNIAKKEFTTQKIRQEWASHEGDILGGTTEETWPANGEDGADNNTLVETSSAAPAAEQTTTAAPAADQTTTAAIDAKSRDKPEESESTTNDESKSKKKRRKKSSMKKKQMQRKSSSSSSETSLTTIVASVSESLKDSPNVPSLPSDCPPATEWHADAVLGGPPTKDLHERNTSTPFELDAPKDAGCNKTSSSGKATNQDVDFEVPSGFSLSGDALYSPESTFKGDTIVSIEGSPIQSDNELELSQAQLVIGHRRTNSASWKWGELPTRDEDSKESPSDEVKQAQRNSMLSNMFSFMKQSKSAQLDGVYLSDLDTEGMDPEVAALYFPQVNKKSGEPMRVAAGNTTEDDRESGKGTSLPNSPSLIDGLKTLDSDYDEEKADDSKCLDFVAMSLCGGLENGSAPTDEQFDRNVISYHEVCQNPAIFSSPLLVVRLNGKYFSWAAACPIVMTIIAYQKPLSNDAIEQLMQVHKIVPNPDAATAKQPRGYSWWTWRRSGGNGKREVEKQSSKDDTAEPVSATEPVAASHGNSIATQASGSDSDSKPPTSFDEQPLPSAATSDIVLELSDDGQTNELYRKSLRLTTEQIESLNLNNGINEISFSVTTAYQGTSRCTCYLFRWKHDDKVVISDIDGTITKSDVLGHILPMVGRDWAQIGVAQLFSKIEENGYKMLYLSARAIGQSRATRDYLRSIRQGDVKLPDGPLLLNPTSLISALHREVIEKKPEQFKIACLSDISDLFPDRNPFYAGYGNRINDVWAYRAVGIPIMRIFTINPKGELKHELTQTFQSSYCNMTYIADQLYPPINTIEESVEFSNFNYWREPVLELDDFTAAARTSPITTTADGAAHDASTQTSPAPPPTTTDSSSPQSAKNLATIPEHRSE